MGTHRARLIGAALALVAASVSAGELEQANERGISWGVDAVLDGIRAPRADTLDWLFEGALTLEADLGELVGLDDVYVLAHPTLAWGFEENYGWKARAYLAWLSWDGSERWNVLAGLYDVGWHFHSLPSVSTFSRLPGQTTGGFSPGGLGLLDPFPLSAPAVRIEWKPRANWAVHFASVWLEPGHSLATHTLAAGSERLLLIGEVNWSREGDEENRCHHRRAGLGGWLLPGARLEDSSRTPGGLYAFADARLWSETAASEQGLAAFVSLSAAAHRDGPWEKRAVAGLESTGLLPRRAADRTALAFIAEETAATTSETGRHRWSAAAELLYRVPLGELAYAQASIQWRRPLDADGEDEEWKLGLTFGLSL